MPATTEDCKPATIADINRIFDDLRRYNTARQTIESELSSLRQRVEALEQIAHDEETARMERSEREE
jgi:prefoldin subunit 5